MFRQLPLAMMCALLIAPTAAAHTYHFFTEMNGANENPSNDSLGTGTSHVIIDTDLLTMRVIAEFSGLTGTVTQAHIHCCAVPPGNVGIASITPSFTDFPLNGTSGTYDFTYDMTQASSYNPAFITNNGGTVSSAFQVLFDAMSGVDPEGREAYFNIHSTFRAGGEIRGFFNLIPEPTTAVLGLMGLALPLIWRRSR